jgi:hypothetical protein
MAVLKRLLAACATDVSGPEDDAVVDYCENLIQVLGMGRFEGVRAR